PVYLKFPYKLLLRPRVRAPHILRSFTESNRGCIDVLMDRGVAILVTNGVGGVGTTVGATGEPGTIAGAIAGDSISIANNSASVISDGPGNCAHAALLLTAATLPPANAR